MRDATRVVRAGMPPAEQGEPFHPGPVFAAKFHLAGDPGQVSYSYGRMHNPTWTHFEEALAELEGGPSRVFASGMAAVSAVLGSVLRPGDVLVIPDDGYFTARLLMDGYFTEMGIVIRRAPTTGNAQAALLDGAKLLWIETPSNPGLDVCELSTLIAAAQAKGVLTAVDNTTATVLGQKPLHFGADFSVSSDTKALTGHSDLVMGHVAVRETRWLNAITQWRTRIGAIPGPMEVWLAHRSLATLDVRMERIQANALAIARYLKTRDDVTNVRYPGLPDDPAYPIASRQMTHFGPIVCFELPNKSTAERFFAASKLVAEATSFGGVHTSGERRARWGGDAISEGYIRLSLGIEHADDLIADLEQALNACRE
ncbi:cystathionine gamma-lyase [Tuwongella immobilis]|uniref:Cystathionine gamma-lyase n=1 Tax=Tuwongella immobilis TaxID=692036 RepID=A0A6C2YVC5_9BACT|nr:cystathionine gamma-lyase [Tuwongella immobilis]VIP04939.1 cystathionine gamma-lyase : CysMet metabolism pyridoxal-phosphate-dependent protein OS=Streptomyces fulvissimus DSM 40593 GN=SFUL_3600 PE=3 SV=1: Cys_Met_Meta_PP [Tuwongella immobilis]VTS07236.1 cystathionine gamma-lyase : CysMet metabolism pyridoxal-phosphate-dependent protein OS=Streptomyces fulvissimus DSM 40593 GN=SFUL_3600 PE=3 SV=1: Cys_Met_Meta_PP [Tuwongella immobilis]